MNIILHFQKKNVFLKLLPLKVIVIYKKKTKPMKQHYE